MKKFISTAILVALLSSLTVGCVGAKDNSIKVIYDGQKIEFDVQPEIIDDRVMVPMRTIFETFGMKVKWDGETQTITAKRKSKTIGMAIGSNDMTKNDDTVSFDTAPVITDGRTLVPVRAISDLLGLDVEWDSDEKTVVITTPDEAKDEAWKENTGKINLNTLEVTGDGVNVENNIITVSAGGDFEVTGTLDDGQIIVDTEDEVKLRLSGMSLTNKSGSAIYIKNADKAHITVTENTENTLTDGESYTSGDENEKACITSRDNLEIKGKGSLTVNGNYSHGIDGSDSVEIENGNITVNAKNDGIHVNETLAISGGNVTITAEGDGIQADEIVDITDGVVNIVTTGVITGSEADASSKGIKADWMLDIAGGDITINSTDHAIKCTSDINIKDGKIEITSEDKGIKAEGNIVIDDGEIDILKATEGIETKQIMTVNGGDINITASDDGINAGGGNTMGGFGGGGMQRPDNMTMPEGMQFSDRMEMPENMEKNEEDSTLMPRPARPENSENRPQRPGREDITAPGGAQMTEEMTPPDGMTMPEGLERPDGMTMPEEMERPDGMTMPEGMEKPDGDTPPQMPGGGFGMGSNEISTEHHIQINDGNIYINAKYDGIDSNGSVCIDGGNIIIEGTPVSGGGEVGLDADGAFVINGGELFASGGSMGSVSGTQNTVIINLSETVSKGSVFEIKNSSGSTVAKLTASADFRTMVYSSQKLKTGEEYKVYTDNNEVLTFTVSEGSSNVGSGNAGMGGGFGGGRGQKGNRAEEAQQQLQ